MTKPHNTLLTAAHVTFDGVPLANVSRMLWGGSSGWDEGPFQLAPAGL